MASGIIILPNRAMTRRVNQRGGFTAIDSYYHIRRATELFGPLGQDWGFHADFKFENNLAIAIAIAPHMAVQYESAMVALKRKYADAHVLENGNSAEHPADAPQKKRKNAKPQMQPQNEMTH